jgi:hypothetical protein
MMTWTLVFLLLVAATPPKEPTVYPILDKDERLRQTMSLTRPPETLGKLVGVVAKQTGASIACQGDFLRLPVLFQVKDVEAREVLTEIGLLTHAVWLKRRGAYLLTEDSPITGFIQQGGSMARANEACVNIARTLTQQQHAILQADGRLPFERLQPKQQYWFDTALSACFWQQPERFQRSVLFNGGGREVRITDGDVPKIMLCAPQVFADGSPSPPLPFRTMAIPRR